MHRPVTLKAKGVGPEGVRLENLRTGEHVVPMDGGDEFRARDVQTLEKRAVEHAALVDLRPHGTVEHKGLATKSFE